MPEIPVFDTEDSTHLVDVPRVDIGAAMAPGEALARSAGAFSDEAAELQQRLADRRRMMTVSNTEAAYSPALADLEHRSGLIPDRQQAIADFNAGAVAIHKQYIDNIGDPQAKALLTDRFNQQAIAYQHSAGEKAFDLESSRHKGDAEQALVTFSTEAAQAPNDHARAIVTDNAIGTIRAAVAGGWMSPEEGAQREIKFHSDVLAVQARNDLNDAIDTQNPDKMYALAQRLSDPANYPGMLQDERESLRSHAETMAYRLQMREASRQAHEDAMAERGLAHAQAHNEAVMLAGVQAGQPISAAQIQQLADHGQISAGGVEALTTARERAEDGRDDPNVAMHLWDRAAQGVGSTADVYGAFNAGKLSKPTAVDLIRTIDAKNQKGDSATDKSNYTILKTALSGQAVEAGNMFGDRSGAAAQWAQAQGEWNRRVTIGGEESGAVLSDMIPRYSSSVTRPTWLAPTRYGTPASSKDVMAAAARLAAQYRSKQISQSDFQGQAELLTNYRRFYAEEDQRAAARASIGKGKPAAGGAQLVGVTPGGNE